MFSWLWSSHKPPRGEAPVFTEVLQGQRVNHACPAVLTARLTGHPPPKVVWFQGSKELPNSPDFRQEFDEASGRISLTIAEVFVDDQGPYRAVAMNEFGKDETTAFVGLKDLEMIERDELRQAPRITEPLKANVIPSHSAVDMTAKFEAFPPPTIKWYKKGKEIKPSVEFNIEHQSNGTKLHIEEVFEDDSGEYEVRIFNDAGEARTAASLVVLKAEEKVLMEPPQFTKALVPQIVPEGEVAILDVEVRATPEASFSWYRHGVKITDDEELEVSITSEDNKSRLVIGEVFEDDSGDYSVTAQNDAGRASSTATLVVEGEGASEAIAPTFDPLLTPLQVMDGQQARFSCRVTGTPTPQIFWFHEGRPIGHHREVKVLQSQDGRVGLVISEVFPEDAGEYTCVARNKAGESRCTATLTVEAYEYTPDSEVSTLVSPSEKVTLRDSVTEEDTLETERGSSSDSDFSDIGSSPEFVERLPTRVQVAEGQPTRLLTKVTGYPRPTVTWLVDGQAVRVSEGLTLENYEDGTSTLSLPAAVVSQCGEYTCEAQNRNGVATCSTFLSVVPSEHSEGTSSSYRKPEWVTRMEELKTAMQAEHVEPQFVQELVNGRVKEMENYVFTVSFVGNPKPEITWYHDNLLIHQQQAFQMRVRGDKAYLTLVEASPKHKGEYVCRAVNAAGEAYTKANLEVIELTYEEKLTIANERYAALNIQHAAQHMKVKERERSEKEKQALKEALQKMKEERQKALIEKERELEEAKQSTWKPHRRLSEAPVVKEVEPQTPKEYRIDQVYTNWKAPIAIEESYPEIVPEEFSPSQIPGVKCFVRVSDTSIRGEEVVKEIAPKFFEDEQVIIELARVHTLLRNSVRVNEIWSMFRAGEFPALQQPSIQTALVKICEYIGHQRNVSLVLAEETKMQASQHPVGLKAFLRMLKHANNVRQDILFKEVIPREMGKWSTTTQELEKVSQMLNQGIETEEIIACCVAGQLPQLKKPETQQPLVNIVEKQGHSVMVAQVLVEEAYRDAKEERALAEHAWQVYHEEELAHAAVSQVEKETHVIDFETKISEVETRDVQERLEPQPYRTQPLTPQPSPSQKQDTLQPFVETDDSVISTEFPHTETTEISKVPKPKQKKRVIKRIVRSKGLKGTDVEDTGDQRFVSEAADDIQDTDEPVMYTDVYSEQSDHTQLEIGSDVDLYTMQKLRDLNDTNILEVDRSEEIDQIDQSKRYQPYVDEADHTELIVDSETDAFTRQKQQDLSDSEIMSLEKDQVDHPVPTKYGKPVSKKRPQPEKSKVTQAPVSLKPVKRQLRATPETPSVEQVQLKPTPRKPAQEDKPVETVQLKPIPKQDVDTTTLAQKDVQSLSKILTPEPIPETAPEAYSTPIPEELDFDVPIEPETEQGEQIEPEPTLDTAISRTQITEQVSAPSSPSMKRKIIKRKIIKKKPEVEPEPEQIKFKPPKQRDLKPEEGPEEVVLKPFAKPAREITKPKPSEPVEEKPLNLRPISIPDREDITLEYRDVESVPTVEREIPETIPQELPAAPREEETPAPVEPKAPRKVKPKKVVEDKPEPEPLKFKVKQRPKSPEPEPEEVHLKPIPKKEKEIEEEKPEKLAPIEKPERIEPIPEGEIPQKKTRKIIRKKEEPEPEIVQLKPVKRPEEDEKVEPEKPALKPLKKIEQQVPDEEEVKLRPIKRIPKEEEVPEEVSLKPFKRKEIPKPEEETEPVKLKPVQRPPKPEPEPEEVQLKPVQRPPKPEPEPEEVKLKPVQRPPKPEPEPEEVKLKPVQRPPKPEPEPEKVELKPFKRPEKPAPEPEEVKLKPVQRPPKPEPEPEKVELKPFKRPEKPAPEPEEVKLKPVQRPPKPEPEPEKVELKPFKRPEKPAPEPEEVKLKPVQRPPKPEPEPEKVDLKPVKRPEKPAPEPEEVKLKPVKKPSKPEPSPEEVKLKPIPKPSKQEPEPVPIEPVELKPIPHPKESKPEQIPEQVTLKPVEKPTLPEPVPEPQVLAPATISEEKTAEEFVGDQSVQLQSVEAQRSIQQTVLETSQRVQQVQQVAQSKVQVSVEEGTALQIREAPKQDVTVREEVSQLQQVTSEQPMLMMKESQSMTSQRSESVQMMSQSVTQQQASFSQQESVMNQSIIQQTEVQKSPTVIRKVKKIIKKPKKQSVETVTTETVQEVVQEPQVIEEVTPEQPKVTETVIEEVVQPVGKETTTVTEVAQQPQVYHEESTVERLITDVKQEEQVEVKPTKVVKKKVIKKIVKKPSTEERVEVQREVEDQRTLTIEETQFIPEQEQVTALPEELPEELPETLEIAPAEPAIADTVPETPLDTHITEVVQTQTAPAQETTTTVHRVKKIIKKKKRQEVKAEETVEEVPAEPEPIPEPLPEELPEELPEKVPEEIPEKVPEQVPEKVPEQIPEQLPEELPEQLPEQLPEEVPAPQPIEEPVKPEPQVETVHTEVIQPEPASVEKRTVKTTKKIIKKKKRVEVETAEVPEEEQPEVHEVTETRVTEEIIQELPQPKPAEPVITEVLEEPQEETQHTEILHIETEPEPLPEQVTAIPEVAPEETVEPTPAAPAQPAIAETLQEPALETHITQTVQIDQAPEVETVHKTKKIIKKKKRTEVQVIETPEEPAPVPEPIPEVLPEPVPEPLPEALPEPVPEPLPEVLPEPVPEPLPEALPEPVPEPLPEALPEALPEPIPEEIVQPAPVETVTVTREEPVLETHRTEIVQIDTAPVQETVKITKKIIKKKKRTEVQVTEAQQEPTTVIEEISSVPDTVMETIEPAKLAPIEPITADTQEEPQLETHVTEIVSAKTEPTPIPEQVFTIPEAMPEELPAPEKTVETTTIETREEPVLEVQRTETVQIDTAPVQETVQTTKKVIKKKKKTVQVTEETQEAAREKEQASALPEAITEEVIEQIEIAPTKPISATVTEEPSTLSTHVTETVQILTEPTPKPEQVAAVPEVAPQEVVQPIEIAPVEPAKVEVREEPALVTQTTEIVQIDTAPVQETVQITKKVVKKEKRTKVQATEVVEEQAPVPEPAPVIPESVPEEIVEPAPIAPIEPTKAEPLEEPTLVTHKTEIVQIDEAPVSESVTIQRTKKVIKKKKRAEVQVTEVSEEQTSLAPAHEEVTPLTTQEDTLQSLQTAPVEPISAELTEEPRMESHTTEIVEIETAPLQETDVKIKKKTIKQKKRTEVRTTQVHEDVAELPEQVTHITEVLEEESPEPLSIAPVEPATVTVHEEPTLETSTTEVVQIDSAPVEDVQIQKTKKVIKKKKRTGDVQITEISEDISPRAEQTSDISETLSMEYVEPMPIAPAEPIAAHISEEPQTSTSRVQTVQISTEIAPVPEQVSVLPDTRPEELTQPAEIAPVEQITAEFRHEPQMLTHHTETVTIETAPLQETTVKTTKKIIKKKKRSEIQTSEAAEATLTAQTATDVIEETPEDSFEVFRIAAPEQERIESRKFDYETHTAKVTRVTTEECAPGFKALLHIAKDAKVFTDTVEAQELQTPQLQQDLAKLNIEVKRGAEVQELMTMLKEGDFPALKAPEHQASILDVASRLEKATVTEVLVKEAEKKPEKSIGAKTLLRTIERGQETIEDVIMDVSREFGPKSEPAREVAAVGHLLKEGVRCDEVVTMVEAGLLPGLQKPETQLPIVSMVSNKGHTGVICEVLVEESTKELQPFASKVSSAAVSEYKELLVKAKESSADVKTLTKEMAPGVKAYVEMAEAEKVAIEEIVEKSEVEAEVKKDMRKVGQMVKQGVPSSEVLDLFEAGEFPALRKVEAQAQLLNVVEERGFTAIVNKVTVDEAMQKTEKAIGAKAFVKMMEEAKVDIQEIMTETLPKEFGPDNQKPLEEVAKVSLMIKEGVQAEEIIDMMEANKLPALKKPESQAPLLKVVEQQGQRALVCQVLIEESVKDIKQGLPKVDMASVSSVQSSLTTASASEIVVKEDTGVAVSSSITIQAARAEEVNVGDMLRAIATYVAEEEHENSMHLVEGERVYVIENSDHDWWFVEKHLTKERGYVPSKMLSVDADYTLYVRKRLEEKISNLPVFEKLKKGQKAEAPKITLMLESQSVADGQEAQFVVKVQGTPRPNVTWFRQTAIIKPSEEFQVFYSDDNTATLLIKEVFPEDAGLFTCVVKNLAGYATSEAELVVEGPMSDHGSDTMLASRRSLSRDSSVCDTMEGIPPTFAMKTIRKTCEENAQFEVDVRLVAIPEPEIVWKKDGLILRDSNRIRIVRQKDVHAYRSIILIKGTKKDDEGEYQVYCKNREGEAKCSIFLTITAPEEPVFEELFSDTTVEELGTFRLVARIRGIPTPEVTWSRNGKKIKLEGNVIASYEDEVAVLEVQHASKSDAGKYVCTATNKMGKVSHSANVTVGSDVVTFKRGLESCIVEENSQAVLECRTSKDKEVRWWKGKMEIKTNERITLEHEGLTHRLIIHSSAVSDTGKYKCTFDDQSTWCNMTIKPLEEFAQKLQDVEVLEKDEAVLFVEVSSEKSQVSWHKDGEEIVSGDRLQVIADGRIRRLVISSASLQDEGEYTCVLGDLETTCELSVRELPAEIVKDMTDQTVNKAEKASFAVELSKGDAVVTWFKDGTEIRFSDHYQLSIDGKIQRLLIYNCQNEDAGVYRAVVGKTECSATLKVEGQVEGDFLKKLPPQMDVISTTDAELTVEITKEDRDVTWFRNGEEITVDARFIIKKEKNRRSLVIQNVNLDDTAEYSCVLGSLKTSCRLTVLVLESAPSIDRSSITTEFVVNKGTDVTFTVPFKATPQPTATWSHKGKPIDESKRLVPKISENVATFSIYQVENIDCGEYTLKLVNSCGDVSIDFVLKILDKPSRPGAPEPLKVTDDSVTLHWRAPEDDGGRVIIRYIIEYTFRKETRWEEYRSSEEIRETTVTVTRLTKNEEYSFRVAAVNEVGTSEFSEQSEYIKVAEPIKPEAPEVRELLQPVVTGLRQTIVLRCVITGTPTPDITWTKDGKTITTNLTYENYTATYTIKESNSTTSGTYCCRAENSAGSAETKATVVIQESPQFEFDEKSQAQRLVVGDRWHIPIKVTGFPQPKITWTCNDQPIQAFPRVVVHIEEEDGLTDIAIQKVGREDSAVFSVTAQNSAGRATMSFNLRVDEEEIVEKEVIKERPAAPAGPLEFSEVTTSSARISWQQSPDDGGSEITSYYIEKLEKGQKQWQKVAEVEPNIFTYVVENLNEGREYFFRVFALNAIGLSEALEATETVFIKSPFSPPGPPVGPFDVTDMAETSLVLHWQEPLDDGGSPITGYTVERRTAMKKAWQKIGQTTENVTHFECTNLKKGYTYFFRVFAVNVAGQGPPLQPDEAITAGKKLSVPSKPNGLTVIDVTSKTVTLGWSPPSTTGGADLIGYVIEKRLTESTAEWEKVETVDASVTLYCVENLKEKSEYEFRVFAENPVGLSEEAAVTEYVLLKTHATPPSPPTAPLEARPTGPTSLMIEWGAPESDGGSPLLGYIIAIRDVKRTMWIEVGQVDANFTRLHIKEVQEEHEYNVRVFARNEIGASDPLQTEEPVKIIKPDDFTELPEEDAAPSLSYSTTETLSWMREAGVDADIYSYARGRLLNRDEYFFKVWHQTQQIREESQGEGGEK